ncbi:MAG: YicC family protein [Nitrospirae bacterium]|nr:YicC family protein [Nitrospirota bacterium]
MTGFGSAEKEYCRVEIRSINHRHLDIVLKAPSFLNQIEMSLRTLVKENFSRGKFDIFITVSEQASTELDIKTDLVKKIHTAFRDIQDELSIPGEIDINALINLHGMFIETSQKYDAGTVQDVFREALFDLRAMRAREGGSLAAEIHRMIDSLAGMNEKISGSCEKVLSDTRAKFVERIKVLLEGKEVDGSRILQEAAVIAARLDISEEITRIGSHIRQFRAILAEGGIIGRKLDFILQELNREVNTIASKSSDYGVSSLTVDMKTEIEKIREQVQNIQ